MIKMRLSGFIAGTMVACSLTVQPAMAEDCGVFGNMPKCNNIVSFNDRIVSYTHNPDGTISWDYVQGSGGGRGGTFAGDPQDFYDWTQDWTRARTDNLIPEPSTYALMLLGLAGIGLISRRRRKG